MLITRKETTSDIVPFLFKNRNILKFTDFYTEGRQASFVNMTICIDKVSKQLLFAIQDERLLRRKYNLYDGNSRQWMYDRCHEFDIDTTHIEILDTHGRTNEQLYELHITAPNTKGVAHGHYVDKIYGNHHLYHALSAYAQSGYTDASVLVMDGCDYPVNGTSIAIFDIHDEKATLVKKYDSYVSLGVLYGLGALQCGFAYDEAGKLMGLSTYGKVNDDHFVPFFTVDPYTGEFSEIHASMYQRGYINECPSIAVVLDDQLLSCLKHHYHEDTYTPLIKDEFSFKRADFAALFQKLFETAVFSIVQYMRNTLKSDNLILTGGCALNCVNNGKIIRSKLYDNVYIPNTCDDAGNAIGAAIHNFDIQIHSPLIYNKYTYKIPKEYSTKVSSEYIANKIKQGTIVAWFEGGSEYGPRALCHRSLLANPILKHMAYRLNEIKNRDYWRPLAPVVLDTHFKEYFKDVDKITEPHKNMLVTEYIKEEYRDMLSTICAVDYSSRPQVLTDNRYNSTLYNLMKDHDLPILINTSMNDRGEPICETPDDAIKFCNKNNDVLLVFVKNGAIYIRNKDI